MCAIILFIGTYIFRENYYSIGTLFIALLCLNLVYVLNHVGHLVAARILTLAISNLTILVVSIYDRPGAPYPFMAAVGLAYLLFDFNEKKQRYISAFFPVVGWFVYDLFFEQPVWTDPFHYMVILVTFFLIIIPLNIFKRITHSYEQQLHQSVDKLDDTKNQLLAQNEELLQTTEQLIQTQDQAQKSEKEAQTASKAKSLFLSHMSHEMRTPLNAIIGFTDILKQSIIINKEEKKYFESIRYSAKHLSNILKDVLEISRIEQGKIELHPSKFSLPKLLDELKQNMTFSCSAKGIQFLLAKESSLPDIVYQDASKLNQILLNLCGNATKFTDVGQVKVSVIIEKEESKKWFIKFTISDTGIGIPKDRLNDIFKNFVQINQNPKLGGTGLGLSITKQLVTSLGGTLTATSVLNKGSKFIVTLPFEKVFEHSANNEEGQSININDIPKGKNILVVEDNEMNLMLLLQLLKPLNATIKTAEDAENALKLFNETDFDLLLTDIQLPGMTGIEMVKSLREENTNIPPVIAITADVSYDMHQKIKAEQICERVTKPINRQQLVNALHNCLKNK